MDVTVPHVRHETRNGFLPFPVERVQFSKRASTTSTTAFHCFRTAFADHRAIADPQGTVATAFADRTIDRRDEFLRGEWDVDPDDLRPFDVEERPEAFSAPGIGFLVEPSVFGDLEIAFFTDPAGTPVELLEHV